MGTVVRRVGGRSRHAARTGDVRLQLRERRRDDPQSDCAAASQSVQPCAVAEGPHPAGAVPGGRRHRQRPIARSPISRSSWTPAAATFLVPKTGEPDFVRPFAGLLRTGGASDADDPPDGLGDAPPAAERVTDLSMGDSMLGVSPMIDDLKKRSGLATRHRAASTRARGRVPPRR